MFGLEKLLSFRIVEFIAKKENIKLINLSLVKDNLSQMIIGILLSIGMIEDICLAAVKQNGYALQYIKEQTPDICLAAVKQYGYALQYVEEANTRYLFSCC